MQGKAGRRPWLHDGLHGLLMIHCSWAHQSLSSAFFSLINLVFFHQVIKTCRKMGIQSVAVHSDVDSSAVSGKTTALKNK